MATPTATAVLEPDDIPARGAKSLDVPMQVPRPDADPAATQVACPTPATLARPVEEPAPAASV
jgi:hypothetical protein